MRRAGPTLIAGVLLAVPATASASTGEYVSSRSLLLIGAALLSAALAAVVARRFRMPPVLGEVAAGCVLGALGRAGWIPGGPVAADPLLGTLAEVGILLLMYEAGVEGTLGELVEVARPASVVALAGVVLPIGLGALTLYALAPSLAQSTQLFLASALAATSVGITARVLQDLNASKTPEARVVLGAAVIDDVLGLLVLSAVVSMAGGGLSGRALLVALGKAVGFLVAAIVLGRVLSGRVLALPARIGPANWATTLTLALGLAMVTSALAAASGLAPLIGAFAAGVVLDEVHVRVGMEPGRSLGSYVAPAVSFLAPLFFVRVGASLDLAALGSAFALGVGGALAVAAVAGKLAAGLLVRSARLDGLTVGVGMVPRGEVGLIFLELGRRLPDPAHPALGPEAYAAGLLMVLLTTLLGPLWLAARLRGRVRAA